MMWLFLVFTGVAIVMPPGAQYPPIVGWLAWGVAALIAALTMDRWIKVFPAFLAYGVFNGVSMIATGHLVNDASKPIPRSTAVVMTLLAAGATVMGITLASRKPTVVDRVAALGVFGSLVLGLVDERFTVWSFALMFCSVAIAWWTDRALGRHHRSRGR
jgi:hypothetical protein